MNSSEKYWKIYNFFSKHDWDTSELDDVLERCTEKYGTEEEIQKNMPQAEFDSMIKELEALQSRAVEENSWRDEIEAGDYVDFGSYGKLYVLAVDDSRSSLQLWVSDKKEDRFDPDGPGRFIDKNDAESMIELGSDAADENEAEALASVEVVGSSLTEYSDFSPRVKTAVDYIDDNFHLRKKVVNILLEMDENAKFLLNHFQGMKSDEFPGDDNSTEGKQGAIEAQSQLHKTLNDIIKMLSRTRIG